jgi:hypothetical protein
MRSADHFLREDPVDAREGGRSAWAALLAALVASAAGTAAASTAMVPGEYPTIQAAIDGGADTVAVRSGDYAEVLQAYRGVTLVESSTNGPRLKGLTPEDKEPAPR